MSLFQEQERRILSLSDDLKASREQVDMLAKELSAAKAVVGRTHAERKELENTIEEMMSASGVALAGQLSLQRDRVGLEQVGLTLQDERSFLIF